MLSSLSTFSTAFLQKASEWAGKKSLIGPPKQDRKQSIKNKNNRSLSFHFDLFSGCWFVRFSGFSLISHELLDKTYIYMHIIRTGSMRRLKLCALFVVLMYISRVINENVRKMAKTKTLNFKFMKQMIYYLVGHEILKITVYSFFISTYISRVNGENVRKISKNGNLKIQIYESNDISSCWA